MITINEIGRGLYGAYRLAWRDPGGMAFLDRSPEGAVKSFYAASLLFPIHVVLRVADEWDFISRTPSIPTWFVLEAITYVIGWTLIPVLMISITHWIDRWDRFCDYLVAYNWSQIVMAAIWLPPQVLRLTLGISDSVFLIFGLPVLVLMLMYMWFVFKISLNTTGGMAASLVAGDYVLGLMRFQVFDTVIYGE